MTESSLTAARLKAHLRHRSGCSAWGSDHPQEWRDGDERLCECGAADLLADAREPAQETCDKCKRRVPREFIAIEREDGHPIDDPAGFMWCIVCHSQRVVEGYRSQLADARSDFEAFAEHHRATEAQLAALTQEHEALKVNRDYLFDLPLCRRQLPDGTIPGCTEEALKAWFDVAQDALQQVRVLGPNGTDDWKERTEKNQAQLAALLQERTELAALMQDHAVCACGCPASEHESYGEEGESCEHEMHECVRTSPAVAAMLCQLRADVAQAREEHERLKEQARTISVILSDAGCSAMPIADGVRWLAQELAREQQRAADPAEQRAERYALEAASLTERLMKAEGALARAQALGSIPIGYYVTAIARAEAAEYERDEARGALAAERAKTPTTGSVYQQELVDAMNEERWRDAAFLLTRQVGALDEALAQAKRDADEEASRN